MKQAYKRRPEDFKRRVLELVPDRSTLFEHEFRWLQLIKDHELRDRYYNFHNKHKKHWSTDAAATKNLSEKISEKMKANHQDPSYREQFLKTREQLRGKKMSAEKCEKNRASMKKTMADKYPEETRLGTKRAGWERSWKKRSGTEKYRKWAREYWKKRRLEAKLT